MTRKVRNLTFFGLGSFLIIALLTVVIGLAYMRAYGLVHPARSPIERTPLDMGINQYENIQLVTEDGLKLTAWYIPPKNGAVIICVHGMSGNRSQFLDEAAFLEYKGFGMLLLDLRNHGESEGTVTTLGLYEARDIAAAVTYVLRREGPDTPIAALGHSMGAATVLLATAQIPEIRAVIAISPFTSTEDNISEGIRILTGLPPEFFAPLVIFFGEREAGVDISLVRPVDVIASISPRPVLLIHGAKDELLPVRNSYQLYEAAKEPKELYILEGVGHGGFINSEPKEYPKRIISFLEKYLLP